MCCAWTWLGLRSNYKIQRSFQPLIPACLSLIPCCSYSLPCKPRCYQHPAPATLMLPASQSCFSSELLIFSTFSNILNRFSTPVLSSSAHAMLTRWRLSHFHLQAELQLGCNTVAALTTGHIGMLVL